MKKLLSICVLLALVLTFFAGCELFFPPSESYTDFTPQEKRLLEKYLGEEIPFLPNEEYYLYGLTEESDYEHGMRFLVPDVTEEEVSGYQTMLSAYGDVETIREQGRVIIRYTGEDLTLDLTTYLDENGVLTMEVSAVSKTLSKPVGASPDETPDEDSPLPDTTYRYTDFTSTEKRNFVQYLGGTIPFVPNNEYYIDDYYGTDEFNFAYGFNFYTYGNTTAEFEWYRSLLAKTFDLTDTYTDEYGDKWYTYYDGDIVIDASHYVSEGEAIIDVYVYSETFSLELEENGGGNGGGNSDDTDKKLLTNDGKGLPGASDGVFDIDFKDAQRAKNVTDLETYRDGCPTLGAPGVLVIPVEFADVTASSRNYSIDKIVTAFTGASGSTDYHSVEEYYKISSFGQLDLDITVLDTWFRPKYNSSYYLNYKTDIGGSQMQAGDMLILHEALKMLEGRMDLSRYDTDGNGTIDAVVLINTLDIDEDIDMKWAFRYWNMYQDKSGEYYRYDGVYARDYMWASYAFLHEAYDKNGNITYNDTSAMNTYTYIHEFGHILGADDYYDTSGRESPMEGHDIMDEMLGDHNAFTKFHFGWITSSRLVVTDTSVTLTLENFSKTGDTIIIANNWDETLGAYQEYFIVVYYTNTVLHNTENAGYFARDGIVVYRINASLCKSADGDGYDVYNNNTSPSDAYGTEDNLIEFVKSTDGNYTYIAGDTIPTVTLSTGETLDYTFVVLSLNENTATITFSKVA